MATSSGTCSSVTVEELRTISVLSIVVLGIILLFSKELYFIAFDQEMAEASGVPARMMFFLLLTLVALTVVVSLKTVGAILVFAMVLIPASTAYQLTHSLSTLTWYSHDHWDHLCGRRRVALGGMGHPVWARHRAPFHIPVLPVGTPLAETTTAFHWQRVNSAGRICLPSD